MMENSPAERAKQLHQEMEVSRSKRLFTREEDQSALTQQSKKRMKSISKTTDSVTSGREGNFDIHQDDNRKKISYQMI